MKVLIFTSTIHKIGGAERLSLELAEELNRMGVSTDLLSQYAETMVKESSIVERLKRVGIPNVLFLGLRVNPNIVSLLFAIRKFRKLLVNRKYDTVEVSGITASIIAAFGSLGLRVKVLVGIHSNFNKSRNKGFRNLLFLYTLRVLRHINFYAISESVACDWISYSKVALNRVTVVPNSINKSFFSGASKVDARNALRSELNLDATAIVLLFVGRLTASKGIDTLFEAVEQVFKKNSNVHLIYVGREDRGESPNDALILQAIKKAIKVESLGGRIRFLGERNDVPEIMRGCDLLVHPARLEGFGLILAEAMAIGLPVLASNIGGIPEVLYCTDSVMVSPDNPSELAANILEMLMWSSEKVENAIMSGIARADAFRPEIRAVNIYQILKS